MPTLRKKKGSSLVVQQVKNLVLSLQWLGVTAVAEVQSLAWEFPQALGGAKRKRKKKDLK